MLNTNARTLFGKSHRHFKHAKKLINAAVSKYGNLGNKEFRESLYYDDVYNHLSRALHYTGDAYGAMFYIDTRKLSLSEKVDMVTAVTPVERSRDIESLKGFWSYGTLMEMYKSVRVLLRTVGVIGQKYAECECTATALSFVEGCDLGDNMVSNIATQLYLNNALCKALVRYDDVLRKLKPFVDITESRYGLTVLQDVVCKPSRMVDFNKQLDESFDTWHDLCSNDRDMPKDVYAFSNYAFSTISF